MATRKLITRCVVMIAACVLACSARAQNTCQNMNLWVNGNFEGSNFSCNIYNPNNTWFSNNPPWYGVSHFVCQPIPMLPVLPGVINEATIDHTLGTPYGHYFYLDPRNGTGNVMQISQVVNLASGGSYTFSAFFCSMIMPGVGNIGATVRLMVDNMFFSPPVTLNSTVLNNWLPLTWSTPNLGPGTHTIGIIVVNPQAAPGYDFAIDDIYFGNGSMKVNAGPDKTTCASTPVTLGGSPTAQYGASCSGTGYTYNWTPAVGLSFTNVPNPVLTQATPGNYLYTVTVTDMNGQTCSDQVMVQVQNCPVPCTADNLWVNGTFEDLAVGGQCNIYNPINFLPGPPYYGPTSFIHAENGAIFPGVNQVTIDHTPNTTPVPDYYLFVDPASNVGVTPQVAQQIKVMPGNTVYTFRAWICSMIGASPFWPAQVELRVDNQVLNVTQSNIVSLSSSTANGWTLIQGTYQYTGLVPTYITASIVLHNPVTAGCDFAIDDIYFGAGIIKADAGPDAWVCPNVPHTLGGSPTADYGATCNGNYTYSWTPTTGFLTFSNIANPVIQLSAGSQTYTVTVTDLNGQTCQDQVTVSVYPACRTAGQGESESVEEPTALAVNEDVINVFPVPANDVVHITASHTRPIQVTVYNTMGQKVMEQKMSNKLDLNVADWVKQVYYIHLVDEQTGQRTIKSIVIQ